MNMLTQFLHSGKISKLLALGAIFSLIFLWLFSVWRVYLSPDFIPLHYTVYFGFDRFGPRSDIFLFPTLGTVILGLNLAVSLTLFRQSGLWRGLFLGITLILELILLISLMLVIFKSLV
ncbi:MAG: hypothetical protein Q8L21_03695 [Candidatus Komeilibacteria bacterium]|nr:hypothetical protein [Candidatus Komeilibacteria bacterium]